MSADALCPLSTQFQVDQLMKAARQASRNCARRIETLWVDDTTELRRITLLPGEELPFRRNAQLEKCWRVEAGRGHADIDEAEFALMTRAEISIAPGMLHQIENRGTEPLLLLELRSLPGTQAETMDFQWPEPKRVA